MCKRQIRHHIGICSRQGISEAGPLPFRLGPTMAEGQRITIPASTYNSGAAGLSASTAFRPATLPAALPAALPVSLRRSEQARPGTIPATKHSAVTMRVLVVEDDAPVRHACAQIASGLGYNVETADSVPAAKAMLKRFAFDILLLDLKLPGGGGFALLQEMREAHPRLAAVVMTAFATVNSAVEAMRTGAGDYLAKPFTVEELTAVLERAAERRNALDDSRVLRESFRAGKAATTLAGQSSAMEKLFRMVSKVAYTSHPVLILGEAGTGKELVARAIHANSPHAAKPFVPVDCGSLMPALLASELFGHVKGAFPEAAIDKVGLLAAAGNGTIFLDEIADLPLDLQARLLRTLQDKEIRPAGSTEAIPLHARVLAATQHDLPALVETGRFRKDLFYRLNVVNIRIPPLRERPGDVPALAAQMLDRISRERGVPFTLSDEALRLMAGHDWPGNVRELEHTVERACALSSGPVIHGADMPNSMQPHRFPSHALPISVTASAGVNTQTAYRVVPIVELERQAILNTLRELNGDKMLAARMLGIGKTTLYRKLKEYGIHDELLA